MGYYLQLNVLKSIYFQYHLVQQKQLDKLYQYLYRELFPKYKIPLFNHLTNGNYLSNKSGEYVLISQKICNLKENVI